MRGENILSPMPSVCVRGSPPHARGKFENLHKMHIGGGITPACAGKIMWSPTGETGPGDHPRMRGENYKNFWNFSMVRGSPPHARGKCETPVTGSNCIGITPACAGKISSSGWWVALNRDHPRMRGENRDGKGRHRYRCGSPPHARGKLQFQYLREIMKGITPACAGKI